MLTPAKPVKKTLRVQFCYALVVLVFAIFLIRLFYLQIIRYGYYTSAATASHLKQYEIPAERGEILAQDGDQQVPIVLNEMLYTIYADPTLVKNVDTTAQFLASTLKGDVGTYQQQLRTPDTRYVVLAGRVSEAQKDSVLKGQYPGIGAQGQDYRTYPDGSLASQLLGFVDNDGNGQYGLEQALNSELAGTPGQVKAVTDVNGVPLAATKGNIEKQPVNGNNIVTTINLPMQAQMEQILQQEYQKTKSQGLSAIILDPNTGQIKAMANYPTYDPSNYQSVNDPSLYQNAAITNAIEPGSTMKTLTTSAALDQGVIQPDTSFYDPAHWVVDGFNITDIEQDGGARQQNIASILALSLNTGATWMLMQMSQPGGTQINLHGIDAWHSYMVDHFRLGQPTNVEQGYESSGYVPPADPNNPALGLQFANTSFGQGVQITALQLAAALSSVLNGGTYYQPTLVAQTIAANGKVTVNQPKVVEQHVVKSSTGSELIPLMENVVTTYLHEGFSYMAYPSQYLVGGKTGTAQIAMPTGGYYPDKYNGTYIGFVGGNQPQYVIVVFNIEPNVAGYAGANGGQPVFADLAHMLINNSFVTPKTN